MGSERKWYSFKIREYPKLKDLDPVTQCAGQLHYISKSVAEGMAKVEERRKQVVQYEDFCQNPRRVFDVLVEKLSIAAISRNYCGPERFEATRIGDLPSRDAIEKAILSFESEE